MNGVTSGGQPKIGGGGHPNIEGCVSVCVVLQQNAQTAGEMVSQADDT